jgi:two-component system KDP operon response regulator KdpE
LEEILIDARFEAAPADSYAFVLFAIRRPTAPLADLVRRWHETAPGTTLLAVGGRTLELNRIAMLEAGADAYVREPAEFPELRARVQAAVRRCRSQVRPAQRFSCGGATIDLGARSIRAASHNVHLTPTECEILKHLILRVNETVPSNELVKGLWGTDPQKSVHSLRLFIRKLRSKLEPDPAHPQYLVTEPAL